MHLGVFLLAAACLQFAHVKAWTGSISVTYDRSAHTPNYTEHSYGGSSYTSHYAPSLIGSAISFNGYDETWMGKPTGGGHVIDEVANRDGSPLSRPVRVEGGGSLLADPPLGRFGPEQFWISSTKCTYGFYTSAAVHAKHSIDGDMVAGTDVHVESIPLPRSGPLRGSQHFHLPNPTNYMGGNQFHMPCVLVDWCTRDAGTGDATVSWTFTPGAGTTHPTPQPNTKPKCPNADKNSGSPIDRLRVDFQKALAANGHAVPLRDIDANSLGALPRVTIRIDANGKALPSSACVDEAIANGSAPVHSLSGADSMMLGAIQQVNGQTRVTVRMVDVATGAIGVTGKGDASGTNDVSIQQAATAAIQKLAASTLQKLGPL